jgi:cyclophilin family peptidyl-prolyl cis-trans isomerase
VRTFMTLILGCLLLSPAAAEAQDRKPTPKAKEPVVELTTSMGTIQIKLLPDKAPKTVENFLQYVASGQYDGTVFHRVIESFMIQGGGYDEKYREKTTKTPIENEADNGLSNTRGTVAMARTSDPNSARAQFFINVKDNPGLNHKAKTPSGWGYCVFGRVVSGMDVVDKIKKVPTGAKGSFDSDAPLKEVVIKKARVLK